MHELLQISFAARLAMLAANWVIFFILAAHTRNRLIADEGSRVWWLIMSFAGVSFATSCNMLWNAVVTAGIIAGTPHNELLLSNVITVCSLITLLFAIPLIRVLTLPSRTVWFGTGFIITSAIAGYIWAGEYL